MKCELHIEFNCSYWHHNYGDSILQNRIIFVLSSASQIHNYQPIKISEFRVKQFLCLLSWNQKFFIVPRTNSWALPLSPLKTLKTASFFRFENLHKKFSATPFNPLSNFYVKLQSRLEFWAENFKNILIANHKVKFQARFSTNIKYSRENNVKN